ncbi:hypothetical protein LTR94_028045, partial [Friedmanniomyces endolithicus]
MRTPSGSPCSVGGEATRDPLAQGDLTRGIVDIDAADALDLRFGPAHDAGDLRVSEVGRGHEVGGEGATGIVQVLVPPVALASLIGLDMKNAGQLGDTGNLF